MSIMELNQSRKSMLMSETAFPGEAINTIAIRMYFPESDVQSVRRAVDRVIGNSAVFGFCLEKNEAGNLSFVESDERMYCTLHPEQEKAQAERFCSKAESEPFWGFPECRLYQASVIPVTDAGTMLSFRFHHVLVDGYSMCQIAQRILDALDGKPDAVSGHSAEKDPETLDPAAEKEFWIDYLRDVQYESRILPGSPTGYVRTCYRYGLGRELTGQIERFAREHQITAASVFSGAFALYLAGASQSADAVFLMPRLNRGGEGERAEVGCYTLVVPVRVPVTEDVAFSDLCQTALLQARRASAHKRYGMENILRDLKNESISDGTISEYTLNFYRKALHSQVPFEILLSMDGAMHNHLTVNVTRLKDTYELCYDGRDGIYSAEQVDYFHAAFIGIIGKGVCENPKTAAFFLVGEQEKAALLQMEGPVVPIEDTDSIPSLFRRAVRRYGSRPALYAGNERLSFVQLERVSNRVANALIRLGVRPGELVAFMLGRDIRLIPVMLGILKAGAAFIPIDPQYPRERIHYILKNSRAAFLISSKEAEDSLGISCLEADELLAYEDERDMLFRIPQGRLAYCIYTSGTTGNPKGVMLSHRGIVNITNPENNPFNRDICKNGRGIVAVGSISFDISLFEIFVPMFNGLFVELAPENALVDPAALAKLIKAHGADILHCTPSRLASYLHDRSFAQALHHVKAVLAAGEILPAALVDELSGTYGVRIYNGYGPTETTIGATITEANDNQTIGRPIANVGVMILDRKGRLLPFGATGELHIYGDGVGMGYNGLPEQTARKFVTLYGKRMYKTGDMAQFASDGRILFRGRNDNQVKLRGLRIELSEIENRMYSFAGVGEAHVLVRTLAGSQHLVGFYTGKAGRKIDAQRMRDALKESLPLYMVPDVLKELPAMPQTPGGKTDLRALKAEPVEYTREYRAPSSRTERAICAAFEAILDISPVGAGDPFFELGGDSLHTAELICEIEDRLPGAKIAFEDIFHYPTPELLAQHLYAPEKPKTPVVSLAGLNYAGFEELLAQSTQEHPKKRNMGTILLTGATGFLGAHILIELLEHPDMWERIWCLVRPNERLMAIQRLRSALFYYSENDYSGFFGNRLFVVQGDISGEQVFQNAFDGKIDTVINCAADVSHFAHDDKLDRVNTDGVRNLLNICRAHSAAFVQISTVSVGGVYPAGGKPLTLTERDLYIGQEIRNQYIRSKFMAEYESLRTAVDEKIPVKILRVGNLQGRISDGEFQINSRTNAFTRKITSYVKIGAVPVSLYQSGVNFSPVDEVSKMIVALAGTDAKTAIYHVFPPMEVPYSALFSALKRLGRPVSVVSEEEFEERMALLMKTKEGKALAEGILLEQQNMGYRDTTVAQQLTSSVLLSLGKSWGSITGKYLDQYFAALESLQMFD